MPSIGSRVLDNGLQSLTDECDRIVACSQEPLTFTEAASTFALGSKSYPGGGAWGAPAVASPNGRRVILVEIQDGSVFANGTIRAWAAVDTTTSRLLATSTTQAAQDVIVGNFLKVPQFEVAIPSQ